ncbi:uncharacterized protein PGTG_07850 [Puccinia graminis f. sp. tritici CRL 75-36-700-3]|uniref:Uncharacterized protein n=1 Tax=Puccinia graminis f. sp. tritici (strain CRL 75-36-700-3 / race SCCL) TaxID=418459 RepID=E3KB88_PUCGT|nr:uncharacterized protein PGTG_07850 [Puccinia graminis f. sp. tritici CRL 75-36-700-3]EFP81601.1 hypothetical protein PGTG_07850 [Puccinia graminis f. sp. tritici CRL 75-36-700-3]
MWIAACKNKTVVWEPFHQEGPTRSFLMTSGGIEPVDIQSPQLLKALSNSKTVYIVDGHAPALHLNTWTLLITSPEREHYRHLLKRRDSCLLYMSPWSYEEMQICKSILYPDEAILPTTLMDRLFEWYGGVPRYVLGRNS